MLGNNSAFIPLGLLCIAANVEKNHNVKIESPQIPLINNADYIQTAKNILNHHPDFIGFSTWCISYATALLIAKELKKLAPEIPIIFGGPQASILAKETLEIFPFIDYVLIGEADTSFEILLEELSRKEPRLFSVAGLTYRNGKEIKINPTDVVDLDKLPIPAYKWIKNDDNIILDVGRGCPYKCTYCTTNDFFSKKFRLKSADKIVAEMTAIYKKYKIKKFVFAHDMFTANSKFVANFCRKLIQLKEQEGLEFKWNCSARTDCVSDDTLTLMKQAGCHSIFFGIESGSAKIQKSIRKNLDIPRVLQITELCQQIGLTMHASFIIGFPDETLSDIEETLKTIIHMAVKGVLVQSSELTLLPGTPIYERHYKELKFDGSFSNFSHTLCGRQELNLIVQYPKIFSSFYYLPVDTMTRQEMAFLVHLVNKMSLFRNTLFELDEYIEEEIRQVNILQVFKKIYSEISSEQNKKRVIVSRWIDFISQFINYQKDNIQSLYLNDIFTYEAYNALLLTLFSGIRKQPQKVKTIKPGSNFLIQPTSVWKVFRTSYTLETILPSENKWTGKRRSKKGNYVYLLIAKSESSCKRLKLNKKEVFLLHNLSEIKFKDYYSRVEAILNKEETLQWLKKMHRLGVIEVENSD